MDIFNDFLAVFKDMGDMATSLFKSWDDVESVAMSFISFVENLSFALLNKWF